jgi:hypothetical protein
MSLIPRIMRIVGWIVFACMWIPFTLMFFNMPGEGSYSFDELPRNMLIFLGLTIGMSVIAMGLLFGSSIVSWLLKKIAEARGERTTARVLKMRHTGLRVNRTYDEMQFTLEINTMGGTVNATTEKLLSRFSPVNYQEGMMVNVVYDPMLRIVSLAD